MSEPDKKSKFTHEMRLLGASLLSMAVILLWARYFAPKPTVLPPQANKAAQTAPVSPGNRVPAPSANAASPNRTTAAISAVRL